ncbi:MAG: CHAP domain-containing protein [Sphingomonadales bacterium]|nr:CHAP domain-containing protein [Sphingomonadales bacterium]MBD3773940.1 CHAP domain-containing protein [Paracoccaceae bacterium]
MHKLSHFAVVAALCLPSLADAKSAIGIGDSQPGSVRGGGVAAELPPYLQCVPYARQTSGVQIYGDANTWWDQAAGRYQRGTQPKLGAVMVFQPHRNMVLGHVATVTRIIDSRTVLLSHANWSPIDGRRGQIERDVRAVDVSPGNDWSEVRVWYDPIQALGTTRWPLAGFIYNKPEKGGAPILLASAPRSDRVALAAPMRSVPAAQSQPQSQSRPQPQQLAQRAGSSRAFEQAFGSGFAAPAPQAKQLAAPRQKTMARQLDRSQPRPLAKPLSAPAQRDPLAAAVALYDN